MRASSRKVRMFILVSTTCSSYSRSNSELCELCGSATIQIECATGRVSRVVNSTHSGQLADFE